MSKLLLKLPLTLHKQLKVYAALNNTSVSAVIVEALKATVGHINLTELEK